MKIWKLGLFFFKLLKNIKRRWILFLAKYTTYYTDRAYKRALMTTGGGIGYCAPIIDGFNFNIYMKELRKTDKLLKSLGINFRYLTKKELKELAEWKAELKQKYIEEDLDFIE